MTSGGSSDSQRQDGDNVLDPAEGRGMVILAESPALEDAVAEEVDLGPRRNLQPGISPGELGDRQDGERNKQTDDFIVKVLPGKLLSSLSRE